MGLLGQVLAVVGQVDYGEDRAGSEGTSGE